MSNLSDRIRKQAKSSRKNDPSQKLTEYQNQLAKGEGYNNFKHLLNQEKTHEIEERKQFACTTASFNPSSNVVGKLTNDIDVYIREDGRRGLKARRDFKEGERLFAEKPFFYRSRRPGEDEFDLKWLLISDIAFFYSKKLEMIKSKLKLRESFKPTLDSDDRAWLEHIAVSTKKELSEIRRIFNLVCTYHVRMHFVAVTEGTCIFVERALMTKGLTFANHSCDPNACQLGASTLEEFKQNLAGLSAIRDISSGEEITWSYFPNNPQKGIPRGLKNRQKRLLHEFGFICTCERCLRERKQNKK